VTGRHFSIALVLTAAPLAVAAQGSDDLWEVTMKMEMAGSPMQMPEQTQRVCKPKGRPQEAAMPPDSKCKVIETKQSGRRHTFRMACEDGKNKYTVTGETESTGPDNYRGKMQSSGTMDGEPMNMTQTFSGRKVGTCTYEDPARKQQEMMAQSDAMMAKECRKSIDELQSVMFTMDGSPCTKLKQCEEDAKALAKQHCEGRAYTAAMASEYAPICSRYAADLGGRSYTAMPASTGAEQKPSTTDAIKKGTDKLKKFLKF
jgi:hypothetical protein